MENPTGRHGAGQPAVGQPAVADPAVARGVGLVDFTQSFPTWVIVGLCDCRQMSCFFPASALCPSLKSCSRWLSTAMTFLNWFFNSNFFATAMGFFGGAGGGIEGEGIGGGACLTSELFHVS